MRYQHKIILMNKIISIAETSAHRHLGYVETQYLLRIIYKRYLYVEPVCKYLPGMYISDICYTEQVQPGWPRVSVFLRQLVGEP